MYPIAVLCGGLGTRLLPLTEAVPKAMIPLLGVPFIDFLLRLLVANGITRATLCTAHLSDAIETHVGDGGRFGLKISYSRDGAVRLGTAGAVRKALPLLGDRFGVIYGDSYLPCDFTAVQAGFDASGADGLMTVYRNRGALVPSNVDVRDGKIERYEKNAPAATFEFVDYGLSYYRAHAFDTVSETQPTDLATVVDTLVAGTSLAAYEVTERFYEVGSLEGLLDTEAFIRKRSAT